MTSLRLMTMLAVLAHATLARDLGSSTTIKTPAQLSYEELVYIYQTKHGYQAAKPKTLTPCARAILGCCKNNEINSHCSEMLKCGAHFFDDNPCDDKFILDALNAAKIFYEQFK